MILLTGLKVRLKVFSFFSFFWEEKSKYYCCENTSFLNVNSAGKKCRLKTKQLEIILMKYLDMKQNGFVF